MPNLNLQITAFCLFFSALYSAQRYEVGFRVGHNSLVGDIGSSSYLAHFSSAKGSDIQMNTPYGGALVYRMNFNPHQTVRLDVGYTRVSFNDQSAKEQYRVNRKYFGTNEIFEAAIMGEYQFFPVNNEQQSMLSPYIFVGLGGMVADAPQISLNSDFRRDADGVAMLPSYSEDFVTTSSYGKVKKNIAYIPFGLGLKYKFNYNWSLNAELMFRATFTDGLDYSTVEDKDFKITYNKDIVDSSTGVSLLESQPYKSIAEERRKSFITGRKVGNLESKDWVNTMSLGLTYSFGRPPCYCD